MQFDFDKIENRRNTNSLKWDIPEKELPMWVADMDFQTAPAVREALENRVKHGIFGYQVVPDEWYDAICQWWTNRHQFFIEKEWLTFCTGVVPAITSAVKRLTNMGDNVLVQTPVYDIFFHSIENTGRKVLESSLRYNESRYQIDFQDLEEKLAHPLTTMMIVCNPHNPVGKIWAKEELETIGNLCKKHHVTVLSDEIHCDLTEPGYEYTPFASVSDVCAEISVTCISASKAFNIAGIQSAAVVIPDEGLRQIIVRGLNSDEIAEPNCFATDAVIAAFTKGEPWLEELRVYLSDNKKYVKAYLETKIPDLKMAASKATYLMWIDCSEVIDDTTSLCEFLRNQCGLYLSTGSQYRGNGKHFVRMNTACPREQLRAGLLRLEQGITAYKKWLLEMC